MSYLQAIVIALFQGVTELFPVSSLGHSVLLPAWLGGSWETLVTQSSQASSESSFYLAYIVALHVATALALLWFFRADWVRIIRGFARSSIRMLKSRRWDVQGSDERLAWMLVIATIPVGVTGLALEHTFRTLFAKPLAAAVFLFINGLILLGGEALRRRVKARGASVGETDHSIDPLSRRAARVSDADIAQLGLKDALLVGAFQIAALFAGISRSGVTIFGGLWRRLDHEDAALLLPSPLWRGVVSRIEDSSGISAQAGPRLPIRVRRETTGAAPVVSRPHSIQGRRLRRGRFASTERLSFLSVKSQSRLRSPI